MRAGVIDVGTNSVRVLIADVGPAGLEDVARDLVITRLGEGVDRDRVLKPEPVLRTIEAVRRYSHRCRDAGAERTRIIATSAVRDAANREPFLHGVREATGLDPELLSGEEEARLGFAGATMVVPQAPPYLVCDIGGGSTELVVGRTAAERFVSLDVGSVRLTERHLRADPPTPAEQDALREDARAHVERAARTLGETRDAALIGLAGTITTVAALVLGLERYDRAAIHHARLERRQVAEARARLASMSAARRRALPVMPPGREDVIVGGVLILEEVMDRFAAGECLVSETDLLDGAALALAG